MYVVIMSGGSGKRFWPKSREALPKQFLKVVGEKSMLQSTFERACRLVSQDRIFVVTNEKFSQRVKDEVPNLPASNLLTEPQVKNTAPCAALALFYLKNFYPEDDILLLPADHLIKDVERFAKSVNVAQKRMRKNSGIAIFGVKPKYAETGYGYIKKGVLLEKVDGEPVYAVSSFVEKPDKAKASEFFERGDYLWNSGIFLFGMQKLLNSFKRHLPRIFEKFSSCDFGKKEDFSEEKIRGVYSSIEPVSIDHGVIEKESNIEMIECDFGWNDVGSWRALEEIWPRDEHCNNIKGKYFIKNSSGIVGDINRKLLVALGVEDLIVVDTDDVLFLCNKNSVDRIKEMLSEMEGKEFKKYL